MVADEVVVETRRAGETRGFQWRSTGDGGYTIEEIDVPRLEPAPDAAPFRLETTESAPKVTTASSSPARRSRK